MTGDVTNSGTIAGRTALNLAANNLQNIGGILSADSTSITAAQDIHNTGGRIAAQNALALTAGRDINILSTSQSSATQIGASSFSRTSIDRIAGLYVTNPDGTLVASAGRDVNITAGVVKNSAQTGQAGQTTINAAGNINLATLTTAESANSVRDARNFVRFSQSQEVGSQITTEGSLSLSAGANINARAASIQSQQSTQLIAAGSVNLTEGVSTRSLQEAQFASTKGFMSSRSRTSRTTEDSTQSVGTNVGGNTVNVTANKDINIKGSSVIADKDATLKAGNTVNIEAASNTASNTSFVETKESGFLSGGGFGITYGKREQSLEQKSQSTTAAASTVGAIGGNININAGQAYKQVGSDLIAPTGDINITAKKVDIVEARETSQTTTEQKFKQTALTLSVSSPVISAIQSAQGMAQAASQTSSGRMQALAAASTALNVYNNAKDIGDAATALGKGDLKNAASINVSIGTSKSQSNSSSQSDTARGSSIAAGSNVNITATGADKGAGQQSDILIQGSSVKAANTTTLTADNQVNLLAAKNTSSQTSTNSNSASSIGASFSAQGISANASVSRGSGRSDGQDTTFTNTNVSAGNTAIINSGGDTNVIGATVEANQIKANIGGSLKAESLQDTSTFTSSQRSANASISVPITGGSFGASVGASKSNVDSSFASVGQQSGLKAGDGGFQVDVAKNTALVGAVIASNQAALENARNSFRTGGSLSITDIQNTASFKGTAVGGSVGVGTQPAGSMGLSGVGVGIGSTGGNAASTSTAGISGIAGNTAVRTGDAETGLQRIFDADKVQKEINAQVAITQAFGQQASKTIGDYAQTKTTEAKNLRNAANNATDPEQAKALNAQAQTLEDNWGENGTLRLLAHTVVGGLTGGASGAAGAAAGTLAAPMVADALKNAGVDGALASSITALASTAAGAVAGGIAGAAAEFNEVVNNYLNHKEEVLLDELKKKRAAKKCDEDCERDIRVLQELDRQRDEQIQPLVDACKASRTVGNCEAIAKHYAQTNGYGFASSKYESSGKTGTPYSFNGVLVGKGEDAYYEAPQIRQKDGTTKADPGGLSYGPFQLAANVGGFEEFLKYLSQSVAPEAKGFYKELVDAGGLQAAKTGSKAFVDKFMELTSRDPQFTEYQFESINQTAIRYVKRELTVADVTFDKLSPEQKDAIFSSAVQHGMGAADKANDAVMSKRLADPAGDNFAVKQQQYNEAIKDGKALIAQERALIAQESQLKDRKIELLQSAQGAGAQQLSKIDQQLAALDQQIAQKSLQVQTQTAKVKANQGFIDNTKKALSDAGFKATVEPEQFIKDLYDWRIQKNPSEAKSRYIPERDMLLKQLSERLAVEDLQAKERAKLGFPPEPPVSGNNFFSMTEAQKNAMYEQLLQKNKAATDLKMPKP